MTTVRVVGSNINPTNRAFTVELGVKPSEQGKVNLRPNMVAGWNGTTHLAQARSQPWRARLRTGTSGSQGHITGSCGDMQTLRRVYRLPTGASHLTKAGLPS